MSVEFKGKSKMIERISEAVDRDCPREITNRLRQVLCDLVQDSEVQLPDCVFEHHPDHYCRRLLHQDDKLGYTVLAMTWGPGQSTPVHDHAGMWCVEAVWHGEIEVVQYELLEQREDQFHLEPRTTMRTGVGSAGSLIPPHEYHTIANPDQSQPAVTLHIYAGEMDCCCIFEQTGEDWYRRQSRHLSLDAA
ncbi:cysteine dioxygenase family protein [Wenzhouxiangella marina]|uniref:Cysteine dioxygenase n=1 Tax=Wenzhouxiangella marina TaxID=1579979 RepID=A0A0K0XVJ0_9GAMM|nr:cysteine dioxygenase family protein [Wenzhouxiangella marina]AKS41647.1 cysteine dioxygenase [Wenzhouxiangella marina]MBB6086593.1 putative metal-dependent enzyme (double-stranded beta helix superfamily) [Wenzhouxiangella marina]